MAHCTSLTLFLTGVLAASSPSQQAPAPPVVLITVDTLRADHTAPYGFTQGETPTMSSLAGDGVVFEKAIVQTPITLPSHASILSGTYPMFHGVQDVVGRLRGEVPLLTEWLAGRGYATGAFVGASVLSSDWGLDRGFQHYDDDFGHSAAEGRFDFDRVERSAQEVVDRAVAWVEAQRQGPFFLWVHLYDPHDPYQPPAPFDKRFGKKPYDGEIAYVDSQVGRLFQALKRLQLYDSSVIVFTADHGESLDEHGERHHAFFVYEASLKVPLIIKPSQGRIGGHDVKGVRVSGQVRSIDIAPTIVQLLGRPIPRWVQGEGLAAHMLGRREGIDLPAYAETHYPRIHFGWAPLFSLSTGDKKYIQAPRPEFYDLAEDPSERSNLIANRQALAHQFDERIKSLQRRYGRRDDQTASGAKAVSKAASKDNSEVDSETMARLRSLGYVAFSSGGHSNAEWASLPDPKDKLPVYNKLNQAVEEARQGRPRAALRLLDEVAREEPEMPLIHFLAGTEYAKAGLHLKAAEEFRLTIRYNPESNVARFNLARAYADAGLPESAQEILAELTRLDPGHYAAHQLSARLWAKRGQFDKAVAAQRRVVELRPDDVDAHNNLGAFLFSSNEVDQAAESYFRAVELAGDHLQARINLALALLRLGRLKEASEQASAAIRIEPRSALAHFYLGQSYRLLGRHEEARGEFAKAKKLDPRLQIPSS